MENNKESQRILIDRAYLEWYSLNTLGILFKIPRDSIPNRHDTCSSDRKDQRIPKNPTKKRQCRTGPSRECRDSFEIPRDSSPKARRHSQTRQSSSGLREEPRSTMQTPRRFRSRPVEQRDAPRAGRTSLHIPRARNEYPIEARAPASIAFVRPQRHLPPLAAHARLPPPSLEKMNPSAIYCSSVSPGA